MEYVLIAAIALWPIALACYEVRRYRDAARIAQLTRELETERENSAICGIALRGLIIWRDQQMEGKYDRAKDEAEALHAAARHHEQALRDLLEARQR